MFCSRSTELHFSSFQVLGPDQALPSWGSCFQEPTRLVELPSQLSQLSESSNGLVGKPFHTQGQFHPPGLPSLSPSVFLDVQPPYPMPFRDLRVLLLSPMSWILQSPSSQSVYTLSIIRIFDNQSSVGLVSTKQKGK